MLRIIRRRRLILDLPGWLARAIAWASELAGRLSFGLIEGPITRDQIRQLACDNVVEPGARGLPDLGISPTALQAVLESYLYAYRPGGQYAEIQESAARMRP